MTRRKCIISSCGINLGCGTIAMAFEDMLSPYFDEIIHFSAGGSFKLLQHANRKVYRIAGQNYYYSNTKLNVVNQGLFGLVTHFRLSNTRFPDIENLVTEFTPDVVISVYELIVPTICKQKKIPCIESSDMLFWTLSNNRTDEYVSAHNNSVAAPTRMLAKVVAEISQMDVFN